MTRFVIELSRHVVHPAERLVTQLTPWRNNVKTKYLLLILTLALIVVLTGCPSLVGDDGAGDGDGDDTGEETDTTAPAAVTAVDAAVTSGTVGLIWEDPADEDLDQIQISWEPGGSTPQPVAAGVGSYAATGLSNGQAYTFTIAAVDSSGNVSSAETVAATPRPYANLSGSISGVISFEDSSLVALPDPFSAFISANDFEGSELVAESDYDNQFSFNLDSTSPGVFFTAADLPGTVTSSNPAAQFQSAELRGAYEDGWIYGSDYIIYGTTNSTEWRYAEYVYSDSVTYLSGDTVDEIGDPVSLDVLLAPGWNRVLSVYDVANQSYTVTNGALPGGSAWAIEENPTRAEVVDEIADGDGAFAMYDVDWTFADYLDGIDESVIYGGGLVSSSDNFYLLEIGEDELHLADPPRKIAIRFDYENASGDTAELQGDQTYTLFGTGDYTLDSVRLYVYVQSDPTEQILMLSDDIDTTAATGTVYNVTSGTFTTTTDIETTSFSFTTDGGQVISGSWQAAIPE